MEITEFLYQNLPLIIIFLTAGTVAGITAGLFGIGGGVVMVPILYHFSEQLSIPAEHKIQIITATSLLMVSANSLFSGYMRHKSREVDFSVFLKWLPALIIGAICGASLNIFIKSAFITAAFALFCGFISVKMFFNLHFPSLHKGFAENRAICSVFGFLIASFSSLIGVGGGTLSVPTLNFFGLPLKVATGTSTLFSATIALSADMIYAGLGIITTTDLPCFQIGFINWFALIFIIPAGIAGATIGAKISDKISTDLLRKLFAAVLLISAVKMIYNII